MGAVPKEGAGVEAGWNDGVAEDENKPPPPNAGVWFAVPKPGVDPSPVVPAPNAGVEAAPVVLN